MMLELDTDFFNHLHNGMSVMGDKGYRHMTNFFLNLRRGIRYGETSLCIFHIYLFQQHRLVKTCQLIYFANIRKITHTFNDNIRNVLLILD